MFDTKEREKYTNHAIRCPQCCTNQEYCEYGFNLRNKAIESESTIPIDRWNDDAKDTFTVEVERGWVNATQSHISYGNDCFTALDPETAIRLANALLKAAKEAKKHSRWK